MDPLNTATLEDFGSPLATLSNERIERSSLGSLSADSSRIRLYNKEEKNAARGSKRDGKNKERWQVHRMTEDYVNVVGDLMYPKKTYDVYGPDSSSATSSSSSSSGSTNNSSSSSGSGVKDTSTENKVGCSGIPLSRVNTLGYLTNPLRRRHAIEMWSPYEVAVFEACMTVYGKMFHKIQKQLITKSTKEIIEFYYFWKKTSHYKQWKKNYVPDIRDTPVVVEKSGGSGGGSS